MLCETKNLRRGGDVWGIGEATGAME